MEMEAWPTLRAPAQISALWMLGTGLEQSAKMLL